MRDRYLPSVPQSTLRHILRSSGARPGSLSGFYYIPFFLDSRADTTSAIQWICLLSDLLLKPLHSSPLHSCRDNDCTGLGPFYDDKVCASCLYPLGFSDPTDLADPDPQPGKTLTLSRGGGFSGSGSGSALSDPGFTLANPYMEPSQGLHGK